MTRTHLDSYLRILNNPALATAVSNTAENFRSEVLDSFKYIGDKTVLLYGDVQSGKTSHVLGLIADAADHGFNDFVLLTSDNTRLVGQTYKRALQNFDNFDVYGPNNNDLNRYSIVAQRHATVRPSLIVLNKNAKILEAWKTELSRSNTLHGRPLFIIDDEADAGSMNNKVNSGEVTAVSDILSKIRDLATSCIYVQVTGTPQVILLQAKIDGWKPDLALSFDPGEGYIGGERLFHKISDNPYLRIGPTNSAQEFRHAVCHHLVVSAIMIEANGYPVSNMLIHPSHEQAVHEDYENSTAQIVEDFWNDLAAGIAGPEIEKILEDLSRTSKNLPSILQTEDLLKKMRDRSVVEFHTVNSNNKADEDSWREGVNFIVGGNSLGRGLTFPKLQTVFYSRPTKTPQADTLWQHARMFGYDRDIDLMRVFMPGDIAKNFQVTHLGNEAIKAQLHGSNDIDDIQVILNPGVRATRSSAVNRSYLGSFQGGINYFAADPLNSDLTALDEYLDHLAPGDDDVPVNVQALITLLELIEADPQDFPVRSFIGALAELESNGKRDAELHVRRGRKIAQGTGSFLSENDRKSSDSITSEPVLTMYRIEGDLGWRSNPIWVPNIKLPGKTVYYRVND